MKANLILYQFLPPRKKAEMAGISRKKQEWQERGTPELHCGVNFKAISRILTYTPAPTYIN